MARKSRSRLADDTPKTRKAEARRSRAAHLTSEQFFDFIDKIGAHQTEADEAGMALAAAYKDTDRLGIHRQAAKLFKRLDAKEEPQRNDMLRSFYRFVGWAIDTGRWDGLADLVDAAEQEVADEAAHAPAREAAGADPAPAREGASEKTTAAATRNPPSDPSIGAVAADWDQGDQRPPEEVNKDLDGAGYTYAEGRQAGQLGKGPEANPHAKKTEPFRIWESGRLQGAGEQAETGAANGAGDDPAAVPVKAAGPKRRRAGANGAAAVH